jgi:hypothetical protein
MLVSCLESGEVGVDERLRLFGIADCDARVEGEDMDNGAKGRTDKTRKYT